MFWTIKRILKRVFKILLIIIGCLLVLAFLAFIGIFIWHHIANNLEERDIIKVPGNRIEIYKKEVVHAYKTGEGDYTIVMLPGMGTASPYYDYYKLAKELAKTNQVIVLEPYGYGYSDNTKHKRDLKSYEYELSKVLDYYEIKDNIIILNHSYSGISSLYYANRHPEVKGIICLDCTTAYQIETHVKDGKFTEKTPKESKALSVLAPLGIIRVAYTAFMSKEIEEELLTDIPEEYHRAYKHFLYNKALNITIINEINDIYQNQLDILDEKYNENLYVSTILSDETIKEMKEYKKDGDFKKDWEEMHTSLISNENIQKIYVLKGGHYIHHGNVDEITKIVNNMIAEMPKQE